LSDTGGEPRLIPLNLEDGREAKSNGFRFESGEWLWATAQPGPNLDSGFAGHLLSSSFAAGPEHGRTPFLSRRTNSPQRLGWAIAALQRWVKLAASGADTGEIHIV
jgi:hypothetical protein